MIILISSVIGLANYGINDHVSSITNKINLARLAEVPMAFAQESCPGTCIPVDCPRWNPFCDSYKGADKVSYFEHIVGTNCTKYQVDCYPGTGSCTPSISIACM